MDVYTQSADCHKGDVAALQKVLASGCTYSESDLSYLLRINAGYSHVDCVRLLLEQKADPSLPSMSLRPDGYGQRSSTGRNSLHEACLWGAKPEVVSLLLQYRANVDLQAKHKGKARSAYDIAVAKGHDNLAALLASPHCASQVQARLGEEISPAMASPSSIAPARSRDSSSENF